jgi:hypothetical protein
VSASAIGGDDQQRSVDPPGHGGELAGVAGRRPSPVLALWFPIGPSLAKTTTLPSDDVVVS